MQTSSLLKNVYPAAACQVLQQHFYTKSLITKSLIPTVLLDVVPSLSNSLDLLFFHSSDFRRDFSASPAILASFLLLVINNYWSSSYNTWDGFCGCFKDQLRGATGVRHISNSSCWCVMGNARALRYFPDILWLFLNLYLQRKSHFRSVCKWGCFVFVFGLCSFLLCGASNNWFHGSWYLSLSPPPLLSGLLFFRVIHGLFFSSSLITECPLLHKYERAQREHV